MIPYVAFDPIIVQKNRSHCNYKVFFFEKFRSAIKNPNTFK